MRTTLNPNSTMLPEVKSASPTSRRRSSVGGSGYRITTGVRLRPHQPSTETPSTMDHAQLMQPSHMLRPSAKQEQAYLSLARPFLEQLSLGYSTSLVCYGQTGSGKTHTIFGPPGSLRSDTPDSWGLMPRLLSDMIDIPNVTLSASAIEVYQVRFGFGS